MLHTTFSMTEALAILQPLGMFAGGMVVYAVFVFKFYKFLSRKDVFKIDLNQYNTSQHPFWNKCITTVFYVLEYVILFPVFVFFWFVVLTGFLAFLSQQPEIDNLLLVAIAIVASVRVTAYYNEELSRDLAKMLPFALLGVFLIDVSLVSYDRPLAVLGVMPTMWRTLAYYLFFVIALEFVLRIVYSFVKIFYSEK